MTLDLNARVEELLHQYEAIDVCAAQLLCDRHPGSVLGPHATAAAAASGTRTGLHVPASINGVACPNGDLA